MRLSRFVTACSLALMLAPPPVAAQSRDQIEFMLQLFRPLQQRSFDKRREHCGFIGYSQKGKLVASEVTPGSRDSCPLFLPRDIAVIATFHTHGSFEVPYFNELPSETDMLSDRALNVDGWVATPGGRLWFIDSRAMVARQICGVGCLPVAPGFYKAQAGEIAQSYSFEALSARLSR